MSRSDSAAATDELGCSLAGELAAGDLVLLAGDLAAGKTTLVRGLLRGLGGDPTEVSSPSFVLLQTYRCRRGRIAALHHVDLYRLADSLAELREIGLEELLSDATESGGSKSARATTSRGRSGSTRPTNRVRNSQF